MTKESQEQIKEQDPAQKQVLEPLRSVHTTNFPTILEQLGISLVVSTYQAGRLVLLRADEGKINTHFRMYDRPMGVAADANRITVGTAAQIWYLRNMPAVGHKLEPPDKHDACFVPRQIHVTGDIDIHEMAWGNEFQFGKKRARRNPKRYYPNTLWIVNTKFSCLCTVDHAHNFVPRWRPPFVTALAVEDRCHLNGLGLVNGQPKYVTMLGETDSRGGWRENKANGGLLMDTQHNQIMLRGLSMPHSPRWYNDRLWLLESGEGGLGWVDLASANVHRGEELKKEAYQRIVQLPGFTRGLDFYGPLAFVGLSQVRESATFSGLPIVERLTERICGVWVINIVTGEEVAFLKFEDAVQEIFAVQVLPNIRFPEMLEWNDEHVKNSYVLPDEALADVAR